MKKTFTAYWKMMKYIEENDYKGLVYPNNNYKKYNYTNIISPSLFENGFNTIEIEEPVSDRQKCCDLIHNNKWLKCTDLFYLTDLIRINNDNVNVEYVNTDLLFDHKKFLEEFTPATEEDRIRANEGGE